jgi:CheY-like chemotaxis protein
MPRKRKPPRKILVIDDDPIVATSIHRFLRQVLPASWSVAQETDPRVGLSLAVIDQDVALCFVDLVMPGLDGQTLIEEALKKRPSLRGCIVVCTGLPPDEEVERRLFVELGCLRLDKPFRLEDLERLVWKFIAESVPPKT